MSKYVTEDIKNKWVNYEFMGKPFKLKNNKFYIRAFSTVFNTTHFYDFDKDFMWFSEEDILDKQ